MRLFTSLLEGIGMLGFVGGRLPSGVQPPAEVPSKVPPMSPSDELQLLEKRALEKGMPFEELTEIRRIGDCPAQVRARIKDLHAWLSAH